MPLFYKVLVVGLLILIPYQSDARLYYVNYDGGSDVNSGKTKKSAWKLCPGMNGFSGVYVHQPGDRFTFKGGCLWPAHTLPLTIAYSGTEHAPDIYTSDSTWFKGKAWKMPVFSGQKSYKQLLYAYEKSFFKISKLSFINYGKSGIENDGKALDLSACSHYAISGCTIAPEAWIGLYLHSFSGGIEEDIRIDGNDIKAAGQAIVVAAEAPNTQIKSITISNNDIHDLSSQIVGKTHGDGIHTWNSVQNDNSQYLSDLVISDNRFYGDFSCGDSGHASMTSLIYLTDPGKRAIISGNMLTYSAADKFAALIWIRYFDSVAVKNNTLVMNPAQCDIGIIVGQGDTGKRVFIKNNIFSGAKYCYYIYNDASATVTIDNNNCVPTGPTVAFWNERGKSWSEWQQLGNDRNGIQADPEFLSANDFHLKQTSPCINRSDTSTDILIKGYVKRSANRTIGAYNSKKP